MAYKINVTERADELLDNLMYHLIFRLKNKQAANPTIPLRAPIRAAPLPIATIRHPAATWKT